MILIIKDNAIFATHEDWQEDVVDKYPQEYDVIQIDNAIIKPFLSQYEDITQAPDPRTMFPYIDLRQYGTTTHRIRRLEDIVAHLLCYDAIEPELKERFFREVVVRKMTQENKSAIDVLNEYPLTREEKESLLASLERETSANES